MGGQKNYINFPIQLVNGFFFDKTKTMNNWMYYHFYASAVKISKNVTDKEIDKGADDIGFQLKDTTTSREIGENLFHMYDPKSNPIVGLDKSVFKDYYRSEEKSEFELMTLLCFLALKSIVGNKPYIRAGNDFLLSRMDGNLKKTDLEKLSKEVIRWSSVYKLQKLKSELRQSWGLVHYSRYLHGFYVSFTLNVYELAVIAEDQKRLAKIIFEQQKREEKEARNQALSNTLNWPEL